MKFSRLRLLGFKSFVEPGEFVIERGLTGVVGPNGCGKSNLVEALKWVMGETSAKQMRGSEMEDVIFAGTGQRPARNIAEVMLSLDNKTRTAPAMVNDADQLDIARRIERGHGSAYSVNGREIRARDVQTLFADAATGSRSTALVSQGRIGTLINAKPADRRGVIDEAAGITGLYARRHEGRAALARRRAEPRPCAGRAGGPRGAAQGLEAPGAPGQPLPQSFRPYPPRRSQRAGAEARQCRARLQLRPARWWRDQPDV